MKKLASLLFAIALPIVIAVFNRCNKDQSEPVLITIKPSEITLTTVKTGGYISNDGGAAVTARGVCWGLEQKPTIEGNKTSNGTGSGNFIAELTELAPGTTYFVRAYATNKQGTAYGNQETFKTNIEIPTLSTAAAADITLTTAMTGGNITNNGGDSITARGVCWSTTQNPTITNSFTTDGSGSGTFVSHLTGLSAGTTYYVRAYATNSAGTGYGNQVFFSTSPVVVPSLITAEITAITSYTATSGGSVSNDGGGAVTARGICWSISENPTIANFITSNGTGTGSFSSNMTGLTAGTTYYVRAYATNKAGTGYGNTLTFKTSAIVAPTISTSPVTGVTPKSAVSGGNITSDGGSAITARGVCWNTTGNPTTADKKTAQGTGTGTFSSDISDLNPGTVYYLRAYATNIAGTSYGNIVSFTTTAVVLPVLTTAPITDITIATAISGGNISSDGGSPITARGICWNLTGNPTVADKKTSEGASSGAFTSDLSELVPGTIYYVRAYATNAIGTAYGNQLTFTTLVALPTITTSAATGITFNSAVSGGSIPNNGGAAITMKGICWNTLEDPTIANSKTENGPGTGSFTANMTVLLPATTYYVRAYATNSAGTSYGNQISFTTAPALPSLTTAEVTDITTNSSRSGGNISSDGGAPVTVRGVCWSTSENPTIAGSKTENGTGNGSFLSEPKELLPGTIYYLRAYATNSAGTAYGNQVTFTTLVAIPSLTTAEASAITSSTAVSGGNITNAGGGSVTLRGVCWSTAVNPTVLDSKTEDGTGTGTFSSNLTGLTPGSTYYIRAYATNSAGTAYGNQVSFIASATLPVLTTADASEITTVSSKSGGNISNEGGAPVTVRGICWSTSENPTIAGSKTENGTGTGSFASEMTSLLPGTTYFVRAYATNSAGTAYGNQVSFTTLVALATLTTADASGITLTTAVSGGNITDAGGGTITLRGVCWSTTANPTVSNSKTENGTGTGAFISNLTGLTPGTIYYIRAYATNSAGTSYGNQVSLTTLPVGSAMLTTTAISALTSTTATSGGNITDNGGGEITARGICWNITASPTIDGPHTTSGTGNGIFISNLTGLINGTTYYVRAYATNSAGTTYGNEIIFITPVTDIQGNIYKTVKIGNQVWMAENLRTTKYSDNTDIVNVTVDTLWSKLATPAYCVFANNPANRSIYGALYNWYAVNTKKICPTGWHTPSDTEYNTLEITLGMPAADSDKWGWRGVDGGVKIKSTVSWDSSGNGTNVSGFTALPAGYRQYTHGDYWGLGRTTYFWSATDDAHNGNPTVAWYRRLDATKNGIYKATTSKSGGKYVRCIKN